MWLLPLPNGVWLLIANLLFGLMLVAITTTGSSLLAANLLSLLITAVLSLAIFRLLQRSRVLGFLADKELGKEKQRSESLLLNVLPKSVAERLVESPSAIADSCPEATVMFAEMVGFGEWVNGRPANEVVQQLNGFF